MSKYTYVKVRVDETERQWLESMVATGEASSMAAAIRRLAFERTGQREMAVLLSEISGAHLCLCELVRAALQNKVLYESEIYAMEREVARIARNAAKLSRRWSRWQP